MSKRINSCKKGKAGERELANFLRDTFGLATRRGQQHTGLEGQDVVGLDGIHIECKRVESLNLDVAMTQAINDAGLRVPSVWHRKNKRPWKVTLLVQDLDTFCGAWLICRQDAKLKLNRYTLNPMTPTTHVPQNSCPVTDSST